MSAYDLARGLHILAVIAWMAGLLFLPRLYAYDAEQADKPEPLRTQMRSLLQTWQQRLSGIILGPAMGAAWLFGGWLIWLDGTARGWSFLLEPWMIAKLAGVLALTGWHGFLTAEGRRVRAGTSVRTGRFWRMTNEIPFVIAIVMVLSVTTEWTLG
ncbi:CopD family protein [Brevundimonas vitis]|uniref:Protoporphyrinogen IX oxidase n=1 Tax=Brevundimonas vitisensis TaxID=2800818 RepID=A0ABX7BMK7_9CAUL|nr:CopD family protein [Brevundimonas vitisensis]QQQ17581.1 CopD family protein [Brevundimonas vitisensis]